MSTISEQDSKKTMKRSNSLSDHFLKSKPILKRNSIANMKSKEFKKKIDKMREAEEDKEQKKIKRITSRKNRYKRAKSKLKIDKTELSRFEVLE